MGYTLRTERISPQAKLSGCITEGWYHPDISAQNELGFFLYAGRSKYYEPLLAGQHAENHIIDPL